MLALIWLEFDGLQAMDECRVGEGLCKVQMKDKGEGDC